MTLAGCANLTGMFQRSFRYSSTPGAHLQTCTGFTFSNCEFSADIEIERNLRIEHGVHSEAVACYALHMSVFSPPPSPGAICTPEYEVALQIRHIMSFFFGVFFGNSADEVRLYSAGLTSKFLPEVFAPNHKCSRAVEAGFPSFVSKILRLERRAYVTVLRCMAAHEHALLSLLHPPELAYSLFVFALESLAQGFDEFTPGWNDIDVGFRKRIEKILGGLEVDVASALKAEMLSDQHLRLQQRVLAFSLKHVGASYFDAVGGPPPPRVRGSNFEQALKNAYGLRSKYAHTLMRAEGIERGAEVATVYDENGRAQVIFTILGLHRLLREVLGNFIESQVGVDKDFEYAQNLEQPPGAARMPYPAEYWLNNTEGLQADVDTAKIYFEGLLYSYDQRILRKMTQPTLLGLDAGGRFILSLRPDSPPNLEAIGRRAESLMKGSTGKTRTLLTAIQILCGTLRQFKNGQAPGCIPELRAAVIAQAWTTHPWAAADCETAVKAIFVRSKESTIIPERLEIAMFIYLANAYNAEGDVGRSMQCLIDARREASSDQNLQLIISHAYNNHLVIPLESNFPRFILPRMEDSRAPSDLKAAKTTDAGNSEGRLAGVESDDSGAAKTGATEVASERSGAKNDDGGSGDSNP